MYKRLLILSVIIVAALSGLTLLGYHAIGRWSEALRWKQFAEVAELIKGDVKRKLDTFMDAEENRPYFHYQYYYALDNIAANPDQVPLRVSPLAGRLERSFAFGYFQLEPDNRIVTANDYLLQTEGANLRNTTIYAQTQLNRDNIKKNLLPVLSNVGTDSSASGTQKKAAQLWTDKKNAVQADESTKKTSQKQDRATRQSRRRVAKNYEIWEHRERAAQVTEQNRIVFQANMTSNTIGAVRQVLLDGNVQTQEAARAQTQTEQIPTAAQTGVRTNADLPQPSVQTVNTTGETAQSFPQHQQAVQGQRQLLGASNVVASVSLDPSTNAGLAMARGQSETVKVRVGPLVPMVTGGGDAEKSIFGGQVFLIRDVRIEDRYFRQGFKLNEKKLIEEVEESAARFARDGMSFELPQVTDKPIDNGDVAWEAVLDFGFGHLVLYLKETVPELIVQQASHLRTVYFGIVVIVFLAVTLGMVSLWRYARAQLKLAEKKDDFISAVSHEFRTPLTSIRMYSEMLEKNWVKSQDKLTEYYRNMRQESERLSRLIENVLDFSRIQKGRKKYAFGVGDLNLCVAGVAEMMRPYAAQFGFSVKTELEQLRQTTFDKDAVKQILVNLLDNAIKYARNAEDKTITIRTKGDSQFVLIEVEDHGPGVPHRQRKKIFEEFYRVGSEATRETTGTGLGLALVRKFAQAHNGFVEILTAKPAGAIFRVGLAMQS